MSALAAMIVLAALSAPAGGDTSHAGKVAIFASTMAIAKTVKEICPGSRRTIIFSSQAELVAMVAKLQVSGTQFEG